MDRKLAAATALLAALALAAVALAPAPAAARAPAPVITKVSPRSVAVGRTLYLRGRHFAPRGTRVAFQRADGRSVFERAHRVTRTKLAVRVPTRLESLLARGEDGSPQPTVFRLRVITSRAGRPTRPALSPTVARSDGSAGPQSESADCDRDGTVDADDADDDNDLLTDGTETALRMAVCNVDSDGDGMQDGWEYWSARDLNDRAVPHPGKRPYPNPLDASDGGVDFDGDTLTSSEEHAAWAFEAARGGKRFDAALLDAPGVSPMAYSDGIQTSTPARPPLVPAFVTDVLSSGRYAQTEEYADWLDTHDFGVWSDDERDADLDGLSNHTETHGPGHAAWWDAYWDAQEVPPWPQTYYGSYKQRPFADVTIADPDADGDTLLDAEDDQDNDDVPNLVEMLYFQWESRYTNAFNPCAPFTDSRTCPRYQPLG
jgi:hypothetical protein